MLGRLIRAYREKHKLTQGELLALLASKGHKLNKARLSRVENDASHGRSTRFSRKELAALESLIEVDRSIVTFLNGDVPDDLLLAPSVKLGQVRVGVALLYAAFGIPDKGPAITKEVATLLGLYKSEGEQFAQARKIQEASNALSDDDVEAIEQTKAELTYTAKQEDRLERSSMEELLKEWESLDLNPQPGQD